MQELAKQSKPEWVDRAWLQIGLIRKAAGQTRKPPKRLQRERVAPRSPLRPEAQLQRRWFCCDSSVALRPKPLLRTLASDAATPSGRAALELATIELERNEPDRRP